MLKKLALGLKLGLSFGSVVLIIVIIATIALMNMSSIRATSINLIQESMPEVKIATSIERSVLNMVFALRGYFLTHDETYFKEGTGHLTDVRKYLAEALQHAAQSPRLASLRENAKKADNATSEYQALLEQTVQQISTMERTLKELGPLGDKFMDNCQLLINRQTKFLETDASDLENATSIGLKNSLKQITLLNEARNLGHKAIHHMWKSLQRRDMQLMAEAKTLFDQVAPRLDEVKMLESDISVIKNIEAIREAKDTFLSSLRTLDESFREVERLTNDQREAANQVIELAKSAALTGIGDAVDSSQRSFAALSSASIVIMIGGIIGFGVAIALAVFITVGITTSIKRIIGALSNSTVETIEAANQMSQSSLQLSQSANEQAASIEETSSSLTMINDMTQQNSQAASKAQELSQEACGSAEMGKEAMAEMQGSISAINQSSDKISKIINTIEQIAFQTNLLALNAAVEAARAGEYGKGFSVVAEEVRNLAQRATGAARDTTELIADNVGKAKDAVEIVRKVGEVFKTITDNSDKVAHIISEIASASKEQTQAIGQIVTTVSQLDTITQQNAAAAQETASTSSEYLNQSEILKGIVGDLQELVRGAAEGTEDMRSVANMNEFPRQPVTVSRTDTTLREEKISSGKFSGRINGTEERGELDKSELM